MAGGWGTGASFSPHLHQPSHLQWVLLASQQAGSWSLHALRLLALSLPLSSDCEARIGAGVEGSKSTEGRKTQSCPWGPFQLMGAKGTKQAHTPKYNVKWQCYETQKEQQPMAGRGECEA